MEITKRQDKLPSLLEKARQELAAFNRKELSVSEFSTATGTKMSKPAQAHGERILYCSKVPQASSVLVMKLSEKGAEIMDVIERRKAPVTAPSGAARERGNGDLRALLLGNYQGCPHCDNQTLVLCSACGCLSCIADEAGHMTCPVCRHQGRVVCGGINMEFARQKAAEQAGQHGDQKMLASRAGQPALPRRPK